MSSPSVSPTHCAGFTLLELAAVITLTALIGALGVSAYRTHLVRAQIAAAIASTAKLQTLIAMAFRNDGEPPATARQVQLSEDSLNPSVYVASTDIVNGRIDIRFGKQADASIHNRLLSLTPYETADLEIVWICGNKIRGPGLQPLGFSGGGVQSVQVSTTVEARYLPSNCR